MKVGEGEPIFGCFLLSILDHTLLLSFMKLANSNLQDQLRERVIFFFILPRKPTTVAAIDQKQVVSFTHWNFVAEILFIGMIS